jgi:hypothetical protein
MTGVPLAFEAPLPTEFGAWKEAGATLEGSALQTTRQRD